MALLKLVIILLMFLCKISNVMPFLEYSKVSKEFLKSVQASDFVVPQIYDPYSKRHIHSTAKEHGGHIEHIEISFHLKHRVIVLDLRLNTNIISKTFKQIYQKNGKERIIQPSLREIDHCHYTGKIQGRVNSLAALSTCNGIVGIIHDHDEFHFIEKSTVNDSRLHHIYSTKTINQSDVFRSRRKRNTVHNILGGPYNENENSRFIELGIVFDNGIYNRIGSITEVTSYATTLANLMNAFYSRVNIFIVLVGVVIWTEHNPFVLETGTILNEFTNYVKAVLVNRFYFDNMQLISSVNVVENGVGLAGIGTICGGCSTGVNDDLKATSGMALTMAHELGHNLGLEHDKPGCTCPEDQCIMVDVRRTNTMSHFSSCSIEKLQKSYESGKHHCLKNKPEIISDIWPTCGNGILEPGEECDCGLLQYCETQCCNASTCKLTMDSQCATGKCCDLNTCKLKEAATTCRQVTNECDLPEYCTGDSPHCPEDTFKLDTEMCNDGNSYCHQGFCGIDAIHSKCEANINRKYMECFLLDSHLINENNYCKTNTLTQSSFLCTRWWSKYNSCSQPKYEAMMFGSMPVTIYTSLHSKQNSLMICTMVMVGKHAGVIKDISLCDTNEVQCLSMSDLRNQVSSCPVQCNNNGWCNNKGQCHCKHGFAPPDCSDPGFGGSLISGPSSNPYGFILVRNIMFIVFLGIIPFVGLAMITCYAIMEKYGTWRQSWKGLFTSKEPKPTTSQTICQPEKAFSTQNLYNEQNGFTNCSSLSTPESELVTQTNNIDTNGVSNSSYGLTLLPTFLRRMSFARPGSSAEKHNKATENIYANEVVYVNIKRGGHVQNKNVGTSRKMVNKKDSNSSVLYAEVNKNNGPNHQQKTKAPSALSKNPTQIPKNRSSENQAETVVKSPYEQFAQRKKKVGMIPSTLSEQKQLENINLHKTNKQDCHGRPVSSNSVTSSSKPSVKDIVKKLNRNNR